MCSLTFTGKLGGNLSGATKLEKLPGPSRNGPQANITSATEGLHSTWLIVNNRIRTEKKYRVGLAGEKNGTGHLFCEPCARDGSLMILSYLRGWVITVLRKRQAQYFLKCLYSSEVVGHSWYTKDHGLKLIPL